MRVIFTFKDLDILKGISWDSLVLGADKDFIARNRAAVKKLLEGYLETVRFYKDHFDEALRIIGTKYIKSPAIKKTGPFEISCDAKIDPRSTQVDINLMRQFGYLKRDLRPEQAVDNSLLDEVLAKRR